MSSGPPWWPTACSADVEGAARCYSEQATANTKATTDSTSRPINRFCFTGVRTEAIDKRPPT